MSGDLRAAVEGLRLHPDDGYAYEGCDGPACRAARTRSDPTEPHGVSGLFHHEPGAPCVVCDRLPSGLDVERVVRAVHKVAQRHRIVKDPPPPQSLMSIYGYSAAPADMDAEVAREYAALAPEQPE